MYHPCPETFWPRFTRLGRRAIALAATAALLGSAPVRAEAVSATVGHQPMVSAGLAAGQPFEAWVILDKPLDPRTPGYAVPAGATIRFTFPNDFTPRPGLEHEAVLLYGWPQKAIRAAFTVKADPKNPRSIFIHLDEAIPAGPPERPGLKAIHLRTGELNPHAAGDYPVEVEFTNAGALSGKAKATAHITAQPVPNIAAYNQLHEGRNEDWQHVKPGGEAPIPIDFLVTLPEEARSSLALRQDADGEIAVLSDGKRIGSITTAGVQVILQPESFGPGFARLGIVRMRAKAGKTPGVARIVASLQGGTQHVIHLVIDKAD